MSIAFPFRRDDSSAPYVVRLVPGLDAVRVRPNQTGATVVVPTTSSVLRGERVQLVLAGVRALPIPGVITRVRNNLSSDETEVEIEVAASFVPALRPLHFSRPAPSRRARPVPVIQIQGTAALGALIGPAGNDDGGTISIPCRDAIHAGERVLLEIALDHASDDVTLAGIVTYTHHRGTQSVATAEIVIDRSHRTRVLYVVEALRGLRPATSRQHRRIVSSTSARWWRGALEERCELGDLSRGGTFLLSSNPPPVGTRLPVDLQPDGKDPVRMFSEVVWVSTDRERPGFGVRFRLVGKREAAKLDTVVKESAA